MQASKTGLLKGRAGMLLKENHQNSLILGGEKQYLEQIHFSVFEIITERHARYGRCWVLGVFFLACKLTEVKDEIVEWLFVLTAAQ